MKDKKKQGMIIREIPVICSHCGGTGEVQEFSGSYTGLMKDCKLCSGLGRIYIKETIF